MAQSIVFFDIETTTQIPRDIIEFGAIVIDKVTLNEIEKYETLIYSNNITKRSMSINNITPDMVRNKPLFSQVAEKIFTILNKQIWAGHNITSFDKTEINKHFKKINKESPEPVSIIDTLPLIKQIFGYKAGNLKMNTLGLYFGLEPEKHRAISDCILNIEVLKRCCMISVLENKIESKSARSPHNVKKLEEKRNEIKKKKRKYSYNFKKVEPRIIIYILEQIVETNNKDYSKITNELNEYQIPAPNSSKKWYNNHIEKLLEIFTTTENLSTADLIIKEKVKC